MKVDWCKVDGGKIQQLKRLMYYYWIWHVLTSYSSLKWHWFVCLKEEIYKQCYLNLLMEYIRVYTRGVFGAYVGERQTHQILMTTACQIEEKQTREWFSCAVMKTISINHLSYTKSMLFFFTSSILTWELICRANKEINSKSTEEITSTELIGSIHKVY